MNLKKNLLVTILFLWLTLIVWNFSYAKDYEYKNLNDLMFDRYFLDDENYIRNEVEVVDEVREVGNYLFFNIL